MFPAPAVAANPPILKKRRLSEGNQYIFNETEINYQKLWKNYFEATTIASRINKRLHQQQVPKR